MLIFLSYYKKLEYKNMEYWSALIAGSKTNEGSPL